MKKLVSKNQAPCDFNKYTPKVTKFDTDIGSDLLNNTIKDLTDQIKTPINPSIPVDITLDGKEYTNDEIATNIIDSILEDDVDIDRDEILAMLFHQSSKYRSNHPQNWKQIIGNSILLKNKLPLPTASLLYTYSIDIQNQAKDFLMNDTADTRNNLETGLIGNLIANSISDRWQFIITNVSDYEAIKQILNTTILNYSNNQKLLGFNADIQKIALSNDDSFTSWVTGSNVDPGSLNRFIMNVLTNFKPTGYTKLLPLNIQGLLNPVGFAFINIDALANSDQLSYQHELKQLQSVTNKIRTFKITNLKKIKNASDYQSSNTQNSKKNYLKKSDILSSRKQRGFHKTLPSAKWQIKMMSKIVNKKTSKVISDMTYHTFKSSFMRANRRHPNDPNLRGRIKKTNYRPDIHIYLDSSGSISEPQYKTAITLLIYIAKKLKTNLYFTSFSDKVARPIKLQTKNTSIKKIYKQIQMVPKISGGTEYENVWKLIDTLEIQNKYRGLSAQLNFIITDFEYNVSSSWNPQLNSASTKSTYYLPLAVSQAGYDLERDWAKTFANQLIDKGDINIKNRIIM